MTILKKLQYHESNQLDEWLDLDEKSTEKFLKEIVLFSKNNQTAIRHYCHQTSPSEFSSLGIVYQALSEYSSEWNPFLYAEIERVVQLAKTKKIQPSNLEVLSDISLELMVAKDLATYIKIMDFLTLHLHVKNEKNFNIHLLDIIEWYLTDWEDEDEAIDAESWINKIKNLADSGDLSVKLKAREVLDTNEYTGTLKSLSFIEKLITAFK